MLLIAETGDYFVFVFSASHAQIYDKKGLCGGSPQQFKDFIEEKTGKKVTYIK